MRTSVLLFLLLLPAAVGAVGHHSVFPGDQTIVMAPTGPTISWSVDQVEVDFDNDPSFELDVTTTVSSDIYAEGRVWCAIPWQEEFLVDQGPYIADIYGWEVLDALDDVEDTTFDVDWSPLGNSINDYHLIGDLSYQFRFRFMVDGVLGKWYKTAVYTEADPSGDTTAPVVDDASVEHDFVGLDEPGLPYIEGQFGIHGLDISDDTFESTMTRFQVDVGAGWINSAWSLYTDRAVTLSYLDRDSLIEANDGVYSVRYRVSDGLGNLTDWVNLPDGDMSDYDCEYTYTGAPSIVSGLTVDCSCLGGTFAYLAISCHTMPCYCIVGVRARYDGGDWVTGTLGPRAIVHAGTLVVSGGCTNIDLEYRVSDNGEYSDWESYGSVTCE